MYKTYACLCAKISFILQDYVIRLLHKSGLSHKCIISMVMCKQNTAYIRDKLSYVTIDVVSHKRVIFLGSLYKTTYDY